MEGRRFEAGTSKITIEEWLGNIFFAFQDG